MFSRMKNIGVLMIRARKLLIIGSRLLGMVDPHWCWPVRVTAWRPYKFYCEAEPAHNWPMPSATKLPTTAQPRGTSASCRCCSMDRLQVQYDAWSLLVIFSLLWDKIITTIALLWYYSELITDIIIWSDWSQNKWWQPLSPGLEGYITEDPINLWLLFVAHRSRKQL